MEHTGTTATPDVPSIPLTDSVSIPQVGFGVFQISASTTQQAVEQALEIGYRHIDTAAAYYNEREVGDALKATGMTGKVFVTSKLRNCDQGYDAARVALDTTLNNLGLDHLDLSFTGRSPRSTNTSKPGRRCWKSNRKERSGPAAFRISFPSICSGSSTKPARRRPSTSWRCIRASLRRKR